MHINRSETRSIAIQASPEAVLDVVGDPRALPRWAPAFAQTIRPDDGHWIVNEERVIDVRVAREQGTVDIVAAVDPRIGAFTRVVPNADGAEYMFTVFFPADVEEAAVAAQMATIEDELRAVRGLCERPG